MSDVDLNRGTDGTYQNDALKITASPLTITASTPVTVTGPGVQLTGGSGTIGMTVGDTAYFSARPKNTVSTDMVIGAVNTALPAFGAVLVAQKRATGEMFEIEAYNCFASGMPIPMDEMAFSVTELKLSCLYDSAQDAVFAIRTVTPTTFS